MAGTDTVSRWASARMKICLEKIITSSKTSASLLRMSSGSDWNEGTLGGEFRARDVSHSHVVRAKNGEVGSVCVSCTCGGSLCTGRVWSDQSSSWWFGNPDGRSPRAWCPSGLQTHREREGNKGKSKLSLVSNEQGYHKNSLKLFRHGSMKANLESSWR